MSKRKTIEISRIAEIANGILKNSGADYADVRQGTINLIEAALMETGNYRGFRYLDETEVSADSKPGIRDTANISRTADNFTDTDATRRHYFCS
jgi:hypothetical protein